MFVDKKSLTSSWHMLSIRILICFFLHFFKNHFSECNSPKKKNKTHTQSQAVNYLDCAIRYARATYFQPVGLFLFFLHFCYKDLWYFKTYFTFPPNGVCVCFFYSFICVCCDRPANQVAGKQRIRSKINGKHRWTNPIDK